MGKNEKVCVGNVYIYNETGEEYIVLDSNVMNMSNNCEMGILYRKLHENSPKLFWRSSYSFGSKFRLISIHGGEL